MNGKEIAKFFGGFAASQTLFHSTLAMSEIEFNLFGVSYSQSLNTFAAIASAVVTVALVYYAWIKN